MADRESLEPHQLSSLHGELIRGVPDAADELARLTVPHLTRLMRRRWRRVDAAIVIDALHDSVLAYLANPGSFDASRAPLDKFLVFCADNRVRTALRLEKLRRLRRARWESNNGNPRFVLPSTHEELRDLPGIYARVAQTEAERLFLAAWSTGERGPARLAVCLRLGNLSLKETRAVVKRTMERLRLRLKRLQSEKKK